MPFTTDTFARTSFKILQGSANTGASKEPADEAEASNPTLSVADIFGEEFSTTPDIAVADGEAAFVTLDLTLDPASNDKAYTAAITTVAGSGLDGYINPRTGATYQDADRVGFLIPFSFGPGYRVALKNNGVDVPPLSSEDWYFDYRAGIVTSEDNLSLTNGTVDGYVYIARSLGTRIDDLDVWDTNGSSIFNKNSGNVGVNNSTPVEQLDVDGAIKIGTTTSANDGTVRYTGNNFQGYDGYQWRNLNNDISQVSIATLCDSSGQTGLFNPFKASSYAFFAEDSEWLHNSTGGSATFFSEDGYFVANATGSYELNAVLFFGTSLDTIQTINVFKNDDIVWTADTDVDTVHDRADRSISFIEDLQVGDIIRVESTPSAGTTTVGIGSSFTMFMVGSDHSSTTLLTSSTGTSAEFNIFDEDEHGGAVGFVRGTDWDHNARPQNVTFTQEDGRFTVNKEGTYVFDLALYTGSAITQTFDLKVYVNSVEIYLATPTIVVLTDPIETSLCLILDLAEADFVEVTVDGASNTMFAIAGTTLNLYRINNNRQSFGILTASDPTVGLFSIYASSSYPSFVQDTDWEYNVPPLGITRDVSGFFEVTDGGLYFIKQTAIMSASAGTSDVTLIFRHNGSTFYSSESIVNSAGDPVEKTSSFLIELSPGDQIEIDAILGGGNSLTIEPGTVMNLFKVVDEDAQSGLWSVAGPSTDLYYLNGNVAIGATPDTAKLQVTDSSSDVANLRRIDASAVAGGPILTLEQDDGAALADNHRIGSIFWRSTRDTDSANNFDGASIEAFASNLWAPGNSATRLEFSTAGSSTRTSRMRIGHDGFVKIGGGSGDAVSRLEVTSSQSGQVPFSTNSIFVSTANSDSFFEVDNEDADGGLLMRGFSGGTGASYVYRADTTGGGLSSSLSHGDGLHLYNADTRPIFFHTNNVERMRITDTGVGIGTGSTAPDARLVVADATTGIVRVVNTAASSTAGGGFIDLVHDDGAAIGSGHRIGGIGFRSTEDGVPNFNTGAVISGFATALWTGASTPTRLEFETTPTGSTTRVRRMTINQDGFVGVGPGTISINGATFEVRDLIGGRGIHSWSTAASSPTGGSSIWLGQNDGGVLASGDRIGRLGWYGTLTGSLWNPCASIDVFADAVHTGASLPSRMQFFTAPSGATSPLSRMTIDSTGFVAIGSITTPESLLHLSGATPFLEIENTSETASGILMYDSAAKTTELAQIAYNASAQELNFWVNNTTSPVVNMVDNTSGTDPRVGINTTTPDVMLHVSSNSSVIVPTLRFEDTDTATTANQEIGRLEWESRDTDNAGIAAAIVARATGTAALVELQFFTGGAAALAEPMTISSSGAVGMSASGADAAPSGSTSLTLGTSVSPGNRGALTLNANTIPGAPNREQSTIRLEQFDGGAGYLWVDNTSPGDLRIHTVLPTESTDTSVGQIVGSQPFTGFHFHATNAIEDSENDDGYDGYIAIGDTVALEDGYITRSSFANQKNIAGLFCGFTTSYKSSLTAEATIPNVYWDGYTADGYGYDPSGGDLFSEGVDYTFAIIAAVGDARDFSVSDKLRGFNVCDEGGAISSGDLLCSSSSYGCLMKQSDDIMHSYTVGKVLEDVTFIDGKATGIYGYIYCG